MNNQLIDFKKAFGWLVAIGLLGVGGAIAYQTFSGIVGQRPAYDQEDATSQPPQTLVVTQNLNQIEVPQSEIWQVVSVTDGDTLRAAQGGREARIRLCGIDAPEMEQPLGQEAKDRLESLVAQSNGQIALIPVDTDRYGRTVAEVFILADPELFVQQELLMDGLAWVYPDYVDSCWNGDAMRAAELDAQVRNLGIWNGTHTPPWDYRRQQRQQ